jgi:hypothetical protein
VASLLTVVRRVEVEGAVHLNMLFYLCMVLLPYSTYRVVHMVGPPFTTHSNELPGVSTTSGIQDVRGLYTLIMSYADFLV